MLRLRSFFFFLTWELGGEIPNIFYGNQPITDPILRQGK